MSFPGVRFTFDEVLRASDDWGANCGPVAVAAIAGLTLDELRPKLGDFESKRYTNPTLMWEILRNVLGPERGREGRELSDEGLGRWWKSGWARGWPRYGLVRIQWEGPWMKAGVPIAARYRQTHWVGARHIGDAVQIFDVNAMAAGGWISEANWTGILVPWILGACQPKADGKWHRTHVVEVDFAGLGR